MFFSKSGKRADTSFPSVIAAIVLLMASFLRDGQIAGATRNLWLLPFVSELRVKASPKLESLTLPWSNGEHLPYPVRRHGSLNVG